jgi:hypothetical protein
MPRQKELRTYRRAFTTPRDGKMKDGTIRYRASKLDCEACALKPKCCPNAVSRKIARSIYEAARDKARAIAKTAAYAVSRREGRDALCSSEAKSDSTDCAWRGPSGAKDEFLLAATAQNLRKLAKLVPFPAPTVAT